MRIAKYIANAGICSRREAEKLIQQKKVLINNLICDHPSMQVTDQDDIKVNKKKIKLINKVRLWKMYKPVKVICTNKDPQKRNTVFDFIPKDFPHLISIGRLDFMSEGLLLFTNSGDFARKYELPSSNILRVYRVCVNGSITSSFIRNVNKGIEINNKKYNKVKIKVEKFKSPYTWLIFKMREGKNREIRNICDYFLWSIVNLVRIQYGSIKLIKQKPGEIIEVKNFNSNI